MGLWLRGLGGCGFSGFLGAWVFGFGRREGGRYLGSLSKAFGALGSSREYEGALGYIPPLNPPSLKNPIRVVPLVAGCNAGVPGF